MVVYICITGEQHGFRKAENIQTALDGEFYFFCKVFGIKAAETHINVSKTREVNDDTDAYKEHELSFIVKPYTCSWNHHTNNNAWLKP